MAGIYIHIPFCRQACHYCDFHFSVSQINRPELLSSLKQELQFRASELKQHTVESIYFGGGTPSLLTSDELNVLLDTVYTCFSVAEDAEVTLEANPDDLTEAWLRGLRGTKVNRLSIGIQSFRDEDLLAMNRAHNSRQALDCVPRACDAGIVNISIDLIFGWPGLSFEAWEKNVEQALSLPVQHLSCYGLTIEEKTALSWQLSKGKINSPDEEIAAQQYEFLLQSADEAGIPWYEISNFSRPGFASRHNTANWLGKHYLGVGPSAHSYDGETRSWNISSNAGYIQSIRAGQRNCEVETLGREEKFHETLLTGLRLRRGLDLGRLAADYGLPLSERLTEAASPYISSGQMHCEDGFLRFTSKGLLLADNITAELFII